MRTSSRSKTNYSPVKQMRQQHAERDKQQRRYLASGERLAGSPSSFIELDSPYRRNNGSNGEEDKHHHQQQQQQQQKQQHEYRGRTPTAIKTIDSSSHDWRSESAQEAQEVYVFECCGKSQLLSPGFKLMGTFRCVFFMFNFLVFAFGLADFGMGLWFRIDPKVYEIHKYLETQNFTIAGWILLFGGFTACIMSLVGFLAVCRRDSSIGLLVFYLITMVVLSVLFVGTLVLLTVYGLGHKLEQFITKEVYEQIRRRSMNSEVDDSITSAAQFLDFIQVKMSCCGAVDFKDYGKLGMVIPTTCYAIDKNYLGAPGCGRAIRLLLDIRAGMATGFVSGSIASQLLTIITSVLILCSIYHWRANPRPLTPPVDGLSSSSPPPLPLGTHEGHRHHADFPRTHHQVFQQRPRSRTPIVM